MPDDYSLSLHEVGRLLAVLPTTVRAWADLGLLPSYRSNGRYRFPAEPVYALVGEADSDGARRPMVRQADLALLLGATREDIRALVVRGEITEYTAPSGKPRYRAADVDALVASVSPSDHT